MKPTCLELFHQPKYRKIFIALVNADVPTKI